MIKLFSKNMALQVLLILVALALFWGRAIASPQPMPEGDAILYNLLSKTLTHTPLPAVFIAMLLVLAEGILLNLVLASAALVPQTSLLPTLLYITAASATATTLTPALLINAILIACLHRLMIHGTPLTLPTSRICSVAALIGLASMISLPATAFLLTYLLVAINYRLYGWRDWAAMLLGFAAPYIALVIILLFTGDLSSWWQQTTDTFGSIGVFIGQTTTLKLVANIVLTSIMLIALFAMISQLNEKTVIFQKNAISVILFVFGGIAVLLYTQMLPIEPALFAIPFALCGSNMMLPTRRTMIGHKKRRTWVNDTLLIITLISALLC